MKAYNYKEFLKMFANNFNHEEFQGTRHSFYSIIFLPTIVMLAFNFVNPFSIFRRIAVFSATGGSFISFYFNLKDELMEQAKKDTVIGAQIRHRFQQVAIYDPLYRSFREETTRYSHTHNKVNLKP